MNQKQIELAAKANGTVEHLFRDAIPYSEITFIKINPPQLEELTTYQIITTWACFKDSTQLKIGTITYTKAAGYKFFSLKTTYSRGHIEDVARFIEGLEDAQKETYTYLKEAKFTSITINEPDCPECEKKKRTVPSVAKSERMKIEEGCNDSIFGLLKDLYKTAMSPTFTRPSRRPEIDD